MQNAKTTRLDKVRISFAKKDQIVIAPLPIILRIGHCYTRDEIRSILGGSKVSCLPSVNGKLVAACLSLNFSLAACCCDQASSTRSVALRTDSAAQCSEH
jgi:hypothetical protein